MAEQTYSKGLEGVVAAESGICQIDGQGGRLYYRGYSVEDLAAHSDFEEVTYLLLYENLPTKDELAGFRKRMRAGRALPVPVQEMVRSFPVKGDIMELLQSSVSYLSGYVEHRIHHSDICNCRDTLHQIAQLASVTATAYRFRNGEDYVPPRDDLSHGANFLYMLKGREPSEEEGRMMDVLLLIQAEHGFNASTFTARVVASTKSTCYCSVSAAIGALYGALHGGANWRAMNMFDEIGSPGNAAQWLDKALAAKRKIMGMGHRVYKVQDPRSNIVEQFIRQILEKGGDDHYYRILKAVEEEFHTRIEEKGKPIYPNIDFFSGTLYTLLGVPRELYTPLFAVARAPGWLAHILEQRMDNRLYRPKSLYIGPQPREYVTVDKR